MIEDEKIIDLFVVQNVIRELMTNFPVFYVQLLDGFF